MEIREGDKVNILLNLLNERYNASHKMRERSLNFAIWILGFVIVSVAWLLLNGTCLTTPQRSVLTAIIIFIGIITFWFLRAIKKGFDKNMEVMINIEQALGCYEEGLYTDSKALFPTEYKDIKKQPLSSHFISIYVWIIVAALVAVFMIWFNPNQQGQQRKNKSLKNNAVGEVHDSKRTTDFLKSVSQKRE